MLLRFLADYRDERLREAIGAWLGGALNADFEWLRGRAMLADELTVLQWEQLCFFYGYRPETEQEGKDR